MIAMNIKKQFLLLFAAAAMIISAQSHVFHNNGKYYFSNKVYIKFNQSVLKSGNSGLSLLAAQRKDLNRFGIQKIKKAFQTHSKLKSAAADELSLITEAEFSIPADPYYIAAKISSLPGIEWAEPVFCYKPAYNPNDPSLPSQYAITKIKARSAWDVTKGDPSVIIGIVDTGVDWDHPDLKANIWINEDEIAGNGIDDDNNGFVDDVRGWDIGGLTGTGDNDPMEDKPEHGTHVAGIAGAVTDNGIGVSGVGFNCKIMAVKTAQNNIRADDGSVLIAYGYSGIIYAVDNGAKVINCSWGGSGSSSSGQAVIKYAVDNWALVVGAAGNDNAEGVIFPAAYEGALSVGSTDQTDAKSSFSNFGKELDVMAPGSGILSTWQNDSYSNASGTSMASPVTAGVAALVFSEFPNYTPAQVEEQIRVTADDIYSKNSNFIDLLGTGRINAYKAVVTKDAISVRVRNFTISENGDGDGVLEAGEGGLIDVNFANVLSAVSNLTVTISVNSNFVTVTNSTFSKSSVAAGAEFNNTNSPFGFSISGNAPNNLEVEFELKFSDGSYNAKEWFTALVNPEFRTQSNGNVQLTITGKGTLGFNDYPNNAQGDGFLFKENSNFLFEGALIYGNSESKIVNAARNLSGDRQDSDFLTVQPVLLSIPGKSADQEAVTIFNDAYAGTDAFGIVTELHTYSYSDEPYNNFIILEYTFTNKSASAVEGFYAGLFFDWDLDDAGDNSAAYSYNSNFGYVTSNSGAAEGKYAGAALISSTDYGFFAINNQGDRDFGIYDGFTDVEKWTAISGGIAKIFAGPFDVSFVISGGPLSIPAGGKNKIAFAVAGGDSLKMLDEGVINARDKYMTITNIDDEKGTIPNIFELEQNFPNPFNPSTVIRYQVPAVDALSGDEMQVKLSVYDALGRETAILVNNPQAP